MGSAVTTATITAVTSNTSSLSAVGVVALILLLVFLIEKEVLLSSTRPEVLCAARYLNVVIVPLLLTAGLIATVRLAIATGIVH